MADVMYTGAVFCPCRCRSSSSTPERTNTFFARSSIQRMRPPSSSQSSLRGRRTIEERQIGKAMNRDHHPVAVRTNHIDLPIGKSMRWWEKGAQPNIKEITSAQDLVDSLIHAGDRLVVVDFFSPGCAGCKALHPKICQFAEQNPDVLFLPVNYDKHKSMCYSLNVHVLPFFRFYRGAHGRLCSFSCTNGTIKKFRDALAKHNTDRCSLGTAKGLEENELLALAANKDLCFSFAKKEDTSIRSLEFMEPVPAILELPLSAASLAT